MARICTAVSYSDASGVIHRDIKPANIVLNDGGFAVLTDFDIADVKFATSMSTTVEGGLGTPVFAAPEQLRDAELANERSDVYSLGRLLHYLLLERSPGYQVEKDPVLRDLGEFPPALVEVVRCATQFDPARRYESVDKMQTALLACHTGAAALRARVTRTARWARHNWALLVITFLTIGALSGFAAYQARVAKREATLASRFEELSTKLAALSSEKQQATDKKQTAEERIRELSDRIKAAPSDQLSPLQAELARVQKDRDEALTQLDTIDAKEKEIQAQIEAAKNTEGKRDRSEITQNKVARRGVRPARSLGGSERQLQEHLLRHRRSSSDLSQQEVYLGNVLENPVLAALLSDGNCRDSFVCHRDGLCVVRDDKCVATSDADCRKSTACDINGRCTARDGKCVAASDAD